MQNREELERIANGWKLMLEDAMDNMHYWTSRTAGLSLCLQLKRQTLTGRLL